MRLLTKAVYCKPEHVKDVTYRLYELFLELDAAHPEWGFDVDESWDEAEVAYPDKKEVSLWQLAPDRESYGDKAGWWILTTPDGREEEEGGPWATEKEAREFARQKGWKVVPLADD